MCATADLYDRLEAMKKSILQFCFVADLSDTVSPFGKLHGTINLARVIDKSAQ